MADRLWRVQFEGKLASGALVRNAMHYHESTEILEDFASASEVADNIYTHIGAAYLACLPTDAHVDALVARQVVRWWPPYLEVPEVGAKTVNAVGGIAPGSDRLPDGVTGKISIKSNAAVRGGHGWMLLPGSPSGANLNASAKWELTYWTNLQALAALLDDDVSWGTLPSHTLYPIIYSETRHRQNAERYWFDVVSANASQTPGWLRRRMTVP